MGGHRSPRAVVLTCRLSSVAPSRVALWDRLEEVEELTEIRRACDLARTLRGAAAPDPQLGRLRTMTVKASSATTYPSSSTGSADDCASLRPEAAPEVLANETAQRWERRRAARAARRRRRRSLLGCTAER